MRIRQLYVLFGALLAAACADLTAPSSLNGAWAEDFTIPGSNLQFTLSTNGQVVSGNGTWTGEACCAGVVTIAGGMAAPNVNLVFVFVANGVTVPSRTSQFTGKLLDANTLAGTFSSDGSSEDVVFHRTN